MTLRTDPNERIEISDAIVSYNPQTFQREPVAKASVMETLLQQDNCRAARIVEAMPEQDGVLDGHYVDRLLIRAHCEMQRISEEFQHGQRVAELLLPLLAALSEGGVSRPLRLVDIGCGTGFVLRWLAARGDLGRDVELIGADFNVALVDEARRLAAAEDLNVRFVAADVFALEEPASIYLSTGVLHHFRGDGLVRFFGRHEGPHTEAFAHFDFQPSPLAPFGSWLFHAVRMREPLAKHDGVLSAIRAHSASVLLEAARSGAPDFDVATYSTRLGFLPIPRSFHTLIGLRPRHREAFARSLGRRRSRLSPFS